MTVWDDITERKKDLDRLLREKPQALRGIVEWYAFEVTYTSTVIEGNTLTRPETVAVLNEGRTPANKRLREIDEMRDHEDAYHLAMAIARSSEALGERTVKTLHAALQRRTDPDEAGLYSSHERRIKGSDKVFPSPLQVPPLMEAFGAWLSDQPAQPRPAFDAHYRLVAIHPFSDGNGRTSRLLMNLMLARGGYPPVLIDLPERSEYLSAIVARDADPDDHALADFLAVRLLLSLDSYVSAAKEAI